MTRHIMFMVLQFVFGEPLFSVLRRIPTTGSYWKTEKQFQSAITKWMAIILFSTSMGAWSASAARRSLKLKGLYRGEYWYSRRPWADNDWENNQRNPKQKSGQKSEDPKDSREKKIAECQRILKMRKESMEIYCWQAASAKVSAAPNLPQANQARVSEKTGKQFQTHVQSTVDAFKANSTCDYYKRKVAELEKNAANCDIGKKYLK